MLSGLVAGYAPATPLQMQPRPAALRRCAAAIVASETETEEDPSRLSAFLQRGLPKNQQPVREVQNLRAGFAYDWATDDGYGMKLFSSYAAVMFVVSLPVAYDTYKLLPAQLPELFAAAHTGTAGFLLFFVLRLRNGWGFVERRLQERVNYYETENKGGFLSTKENEVPGLFFLDVHGITLKLHKLRRWTFSLPPLRSAPATRLGDSSPAQSTCKHRPNHGLSSRRAGSLDPRTAQTRCVEPQEKTVRSIAVLQIDSALVFFS